MSEESDVIIKAKILGYLSIIYFFFAIYLTLNSIAMYGTIEEIKIAVISYTACGCGLMFGMIAYLITNSKKQKEETDT